MQMKKVVQSLEQSINDNVDVQRRRFDRRSTDTCMISVNGHPYPVKDWSLSGVMFEADTRTFAINENLPMTLKFHMNGLIATVDVTGRIVRKNTHYIATQFDPLDNKAQQTLHQIIDEANSRDNSDHSQQA